MHLGLSLKVSQRDACHMDSIALNSRWNGQAVASAMDGRNRIYSVAFGFFDTLGNKRTIDLVHDIFPYVLVRCPAACCLLACAAPRPCILSHFTASRRLISRLAADPRCCRASPALQAVVRLCNCAFYLHLNYWSP